MRDQATHPSSKSEHDHLSETRAKVLAAALPNVPFDGWSDALLRAAVRDSGVAPDLARLAFPRGAVDLATAFHRSGDADMLARLAERMADEPEMRFRDKITFAVRARLESASGDKEAVRRAAALFALPIYAPEGAKLIWRTADAIWTAVGDTSEDYNWWTKRATLSGVYSSVVLYWLGDQSEDHAATWAFLDRRIAGVMRFETTKSRVLSNPLGRLAAAGPLAALSCLKAPLGARAQGAPTDLPG